MSDQYIKMILALDEDEFFKEWEWKEGDKFLYNESDQIRTRVIGDTVLSDNKKPGNISQCYYDSSECLFKNIRPIPSQEQLLQIYRIKKDLQYNSLALLWLANWIEDIVTEDHGFCFEYKSAEAMTLLWVQETCYNKTWNGDSWEKMK